MDTQQVMQTMTDFVTVYGLRVVGAIVILILGRIVANVLRSALRKGLTRRGVDASLVGFVASIAYFLVIAFAVVAALSKFGIETASFVAILGAAGFAIGFALQGSLSNFASGVMLLLFRPFRPGHFINAAGVSGTVKEIGIFSTVLATPDNTQIIVPNGQIYGGTIQNYSAYDTRRVDLLIGIGYASDIARAREIMMGLIDADDRTLSDPAPLIAISELADSSVNFAVRVWVKSPDYWGVKFELTEAIKKAFDANGIEIPFPQRVVHMMQAEA